MLRLLKKQPQHLQRERFSRLVGITSTAQFAAPGGYRKNLSDNGNLPFADGGFLVDARPALEHGIPCSYGCRGGWFDVFRQ